MGQKKRESSKGTGEKREKKRERETLDHEELKQNWVKRSAKNIAGKLTLKRFFFLNICTNMQVLLIKINTCRAVSMKTKEVPYVKLSELLL